MNQDQKLLLISGAALFAASAAYLMGAGIPQTPLPATLFPLSIIGLFFGFGFILWAAGWIGLERLEVLK